VLELQGLTRRYGDLLALDNLSFTVRERQMFGFVGPNGAGKTTAMRIILGVLEPDAGEVRWRGRPMNHEMRQRIGYLPEDHGQTFSPTVRSSGGPPTPRGPTRHRHRGDRADGAAEDPGRHHSAQRYCRSRRRRRTRHHGPGLGRRGVAPSDRARAACRCLNASSAPPG
jgi:ABC-type dipeptide/oligopeptide/nickel transport system ATPase component